METEELRGTSEDQEQGPREYTIEEALAGYDRRRENKGGRARGRPNRDTQAFIDAAATPGTALVNAERIFHRVDQDTKIKNGRDKGIKGKHGYPDPELIDGYNEERMDRLRQRIEERKELARKFANITPEMVLGATAMRAFGSISDAFDKDGNFDIRLARESGAIHLIKTLYKTRDGFKVEFYSNETAQQQLANWMGMDMAPRENDDTPSLRAAVEAAARAIARELGHGDRVTHELRMIAWERVSRWIQESRARYSQAAMDEMARLYGSRIPMGYSPDPHSGAIEVPLDSPEGEALGLYPVAHSESSQDQDMQSRRDGADQGHDTP